MSPTATQSDPSGHHDWHSPEYVRDWIAADILNDEVRGPFLRRLVDRLPIDRGAPITVLDVGSGYGMLSRALLESLPRAHVVLHDLSDAMLDQARQRLSEFSDRVSFVQADLRTSEWTRVVGGPFDVIASSMAIHNVRQPAQIRRIYLDITGLLTRGGCFVNIDLMPPAGPLAGVAFGRKPDHGEPEGAESFGLLAQMDWLRATGLTQVDCLRRDAGQAVVIGFA
jgi:SAM-dependent methyltransferase